MSNVLFRQLVSFLNTIINMNTINELALGILCDNESIEMNFMNSFINAFVASLVKNLQFVLFCFVFVLLFFSERFE